MKVFAKILVLGAAVAASAPFAHATPITGEVTMSGSGTATISATQIAFTPTTFVLTSSIPQISASDTVHFPSTYLFSNNGKNAIATGSTSPVFSNLPLDTLFYIRDATSGDNLAFLVSSTKDVTPTTATTGQVDLNGGLFLTDGSGTVIGTSAGVFSLTNLNGNMTGSFISDAVTSAATPEPSSLLLLGTGLLGAAGMVFRKRILA